MKKCKYVESNAKFGASPIPQNGKWDIAKRIEDISGFSHGIGKCAPQQGACKLTLNVEKGIIREALIECLGCSGMTHSSGMAVEILVGKTILEALNTDLVCDAINDAMKNIFEQLIYGRSQSAYSLGGLPVGSALSDLGKFGASMVGTVYNSDKIGPRYLQFAEGYIMELALDSNREIIGYKYSKTELMMSLILEGVAVEDAYRKSVSTYGRYDEGVEFIDPRKIESEVERG